MMIESYIISFYHKLINGIEIFVLPIQENCKLIDPTIIPQKQIATINKYRKEHDRNKRLLSRSFCYNYFKTKYNIDCFDLDYNSFNKPNLKHFPIQFNFSYSHQFIAIIIGSKPLEIGIDIEIIEKNLDLGNLSDKIMHSNEIEKFRRIEKIGNKQSFFFKVWTLKEAILKCLGVGISLDLTKLDTMNRKWENIINQTILTDSFQIEHEYWLSFAFLLYSN